MQDSSKILSPKQRPPRLTDERIESLVKLLDSWGGTLTWEAFIAKIQEQTGYRYTRQALDRHNRIKDAFRDRKDHLANQPKDKTERSLSSAEKQRRIDDYERLRGENLRLEAENQQLLGQFVIWLFNSQQAGVDMDVLNRPLPPKYLVPTE